MNRRRFADLSLKTGIAILIAARAFAGFDWRRSTYEYVSDRLAIDLLFGNHAARDLLERGGSADDVIASFATDRGRFLETRAPFLHAGYG